jgi:hypothetical protein
VNNINWKTTEQFWAEECRWEPNLNLTAYIDLCQKYDFTHAMSGWVLIDDVKKIPNLAYDIIHPGKPDIRPLFSHYHSFKTYSGEVYWAISPDDCEWSKEEIESRMFANSIFCKIEQGMRAYNTILFKPKALAVACANYITEKNKDGRFDLHKVNKCLEQDEVVATFSTEKEVKAFQKGFDTAYAHALALLSTNE